MFTGFGKPYGRAQYLKADFTGQGTITEQSLHAGDTLKANSVIHLKLEKK